MTESELEARIRASRNQPGPEGEDVGTPQERRLPRGTGFAISAGISLALWSIIIWIACK